MLSSRRATAKSFQNLSGLLTSLGHRCAVHAEERRGIQGGGRIRAPYLVDAATQPAAHFHPQPSSCLLSPQLRITGSIATGVMVIAAADLLLTIGR